MSNFSLEDYKKYQEETERAVNEALLDLRRFPRPKPNPRKRKQEPTISWPRGIKVELPDVDPEGEEMCCLSDLEGIRCPFEHCHIPLGEYLLRCAEQNDCPLILHPTSTHHNICAFHWKQIKYSRRGRLYEDLEPMSPLEEIELMADLDQILEKKPFRRRDEEESDSSDSEESCSSSDDEREEVDIMSDIEEYSSESEFDEDETESESDSEESESEELWKRLEIDVRDKNLMDELKALSMAEEIRQGADPDSDDDSLNGWEAVEEAPALESDENSSGSEDSDDEDTSSSSSESEDETDEKPKMVNGIKTPELPSSPAGIPTEGLEDEETSSEDEDVKTGTPKISMITRHRNRLLLLNGDRHYDDVKEEETHHEENGLSVDDTDEDEEKENHDPLEEEDEFDQDTDESTDSEEEESSEESTDNSSEDETSESSDDDLDTEEEKIEKEEETNDPEAFGPGPIHRQLDNLEIDLDVKNEDSDQEALSEENYEMWQDEKETSSESEDSDESDEEDEIVGQVDVNDPVDNPEEIALILQSMSTLPVTTLRRYRKFHGIPTRATATKVSMLPMITRHFSSFEVDPNAIQASFLARRKKRHLINRRHPFRR